MQVEEMKKIMDRSGVSPHAMHFSADGNIIAMSYTPTRNQTRKHKEIEQGL
jgi:hypothetical protein